MANTESKKCVIALLNSTGRSWDKLTAKDAGIEDIGLENR